MQKDFLIRFDSTQCNSMQYDCIEYNIIHIIYLLHAP